MQLPCHCFLFWYEFLLFSWEVHPSLSPRSSRPAAEWAILGGERSTEAVGFLSAARKSVQLLKQKKKKVQHKQSWVKSGHDSCCSSIVSPASHLDTGLEMYFVAPWDATSSCQGGRLHWRLSKTLRAWRSVASLHSVGWWSSIRCRHTRRGSDERQDQVRFLNKHVRALFLTHAHTTLLRPGSSKHLRNVLAGLKGSVVGWGVFALLN